MRSAKLMILLALLAPLAMGSSNDLACSEGSIVIPGLDMKELTITPGHQNYEAQTDFAVAFAFLVDGGQAPYYATFNFGDGTGSEMVSVISGWIPYAAATHAYDEPGQYDGAVVVYDSRDRADEATFHVNVTAWNSGFNEGSGRQAKAPNPPG